MKVGGPPGINPAGQRLDQAYGVKGTRLAVAAEMAPSLLDPGRLLKGRVVSVEGSGLLTVATEFGSFTATSATPLAVGREVWFQVTPAGATPLLAEAGKTNATINLLRVLLPEMVALSGPEVVGEGPEASRLSRLLAANAVDATPDPIKLIKSISQLNLGRSGVASGSDPLPPIPLALGGDLDSPAAQKLARLLEAHALVNQQPAPGARGDYFIYPVFFAEQAGRGEWLFSFEQGGEDEADREGATATLSFYLTMTQLGDIHLSLTARPRGLTGTFTLATPEAADHLRQQLPQLVQALEPLSGAVVITCRSARLDCLTALKDELTAKAGLEERFALVDVKA